MKIFFTTLFVSIFSFLFAQTSHRDVIDVQQYDITMEVTDFTDYVIYANTQIVFQTTQNELGTLIFDLYKLPVDSVLVNGESIANYMVDDTSVQITLPSPIAANQFDTCQIFYHGRPETEPGYGWGGVHTLGSMIFNMGVAIEDVPHGFGRGWFPCIDNFTDRAHYNINIITQNQHRAIATGVLDEVVDLDGDKKMWKWVFNQTSPTYLISFVVGDFTLNTQEYSGIESTIPVEIYARETDSAAAVQTFADVPEMLALYENLFGAYNWDKAGYTVVNFSRGAMEHLTNIAYPNYALSTSLSDQALVAHELSHHWFGNQVTCQTSGDMWLNEGFASYCEALYVEHFHGDAAYDNYVKSNQRSVVGTAHQTDGGYWALSGIPHHLTYSTTVYDKGSMVVHNLRHYMGDEAFFAGIQSYLETFTENHASSADLRDHLTDVSGIDMTGFFDNWVFNGGFPQYSMDSAIIDGSTVTVGVSQKSVGRDFIADANRVEVNFVDENWDIQSEWLEFDGQSGAQTFELGFEPVMTLLDFYNKNADVVIDNSGTIDGLGTVYTGGVDVIMYPQTITDSVFYSVSKMLKGVSGSGQIADDIEALDMPWWYIQYDAKGEFETRMKFSYRTTGLDHLNLDQNDSLIILYRQHAGHAWSIPEHGWFGNVGGGSFMVENAAPGQYAVGRWHGPSSTIGALNTIDFKIWPNPARNGFYYNSAGVGHTLKIYDANGVLASEIAMNAQHGRVFFDAHRLAPGTYYVQLFKNGQKVAVQKWVKVS
jgi:aminopeptidase N